MTLTSASAGGVGAQFRIPYVHVLVDNAYLGLIRQAQAWTDRYRVPLVVEVLLERVTNIAMGPEIDAIVAFEDVLDLAQEPRCAQEALEAAD